MQRRPADLARLAAAFTSVLALAQPVAAQVTPVFTAPMAAPAMPPEPPPREPLTPQRIAQWFEQACVATQGRPGPAVDWALSNGFEPVDPMRGGTDTLLDGKPGTVLVAPDAGGHVLLAASDGQCSVWAEAQEGPPLRVALAALVGTLTARGAKARVEVDRNLERAGAWRSQVQWRLRGVGWSQDVGVGAVTTLGATPGTQVLHVAPMARAVNFAPDGVPLR